MKGYMFLRAIRPSPLVRDLATTGLTSVVSAVMAVVMIRVLAQGLLQDQFGAYSLARRLMAIVAAVAGVSMGVAIPRYIAMAEDTPTRDSYLVSGFMLGLVPSVLIFVVGMIFEEPLTRLIFRDDMYQGLFRATLWLLVGYSLFNVVYALYRGMNRMGRANLWQIAVSALGPMMVAIVFARIGRADLIVAIFAGLMWCALVPVAFYTVRALIRSRHRMTLVPALQRFVRYGLPRVPAGFALAGLFAFGPVLAPYFGSMKDAGYLAAGQSILRVVEGGVVAFGLVALPRLAQLVARDQQATVRNAVENIIAFVLHLGLFGTLHGLLWTDEVVLGLLGTQYVQATPIMRMVILALVPYLGYVMLRSVVDAVEVKAINTVNLFIALTVALIVGCLAAMTGLGAMGLAIGTAVGFLVLGACTIYYLGSVYRFSWRELRLWQVVPLNAGLFVLGLLLKLGLQSRLHGLPMLACAAAAVVGMGLLYVFVLWRFRVSWVVELESRVMADGWRKRD
ncbi:lipopolysaccharide biosynthesis protein [Verrucomicrobiota bacterium]